MKVARQLFGKALVVLEHNNAKLNPSSLSAVSAASKFGDVSVLVAGKGCKAVVDEASKLSGVQNVLQVDSEEYGTLSPENFTTLVKNIQDAKSYSHIVSSHNAFGKSVIPRVAAKFGSMPIADVISIQDESTFVRSSYAGNALQKVKSTDSVKFVTIRPTSFDKAADGGSAAVEEVAAAGESGLSKWIADEVDTSGKPDLGSARVVISGGRGLKNGDNFKMLYDLADKIGNCAGMKLPIKCPLLQLEQHVLLLIQTGLPMTCKLAKLERLWHLNCTLLLVCLVPSSIWLA
eukprot:TRINITY_DN10294_c0_g1_i2.p1 TRINITY_DN10294_c0_g1~~TRINITY_DN10294_c0_g1_i2.p1  ORF type:complete len:290 (+),score=57.63 TRINITY_DN10294_c0_g1_i2:58-927(+)